MNIRNTLLITFFISFLVASSQSLHIEINNIHHGYKTSVSGVSQVIQQGSSNKILLTNTRWEMNQLESELIPFFNKIGKDKVEFDLGKQMIQGVFEEDNEVILLVFSENTSIITTVTFRPHSDDSDQKLQQISEIIKKKCEWSQQAL